MDYRTKIKKHEGHIAFMANGTVWANYICEGVPVDFYTPGSLESAQRQHTELFNHLVGLNFAEIFLGGFLTRVSVADRVRPVMEGIPVPEEYKGNPKLAYPDLAPSLAAYHAALESGKYPRFRRLYWISVRLPVKTSMGERLASQLYDSDPFEELERTDQHNALRRADKEIISRISEEFGLRKVQASDYDWLYDRIRLRGVQIPEVSWYLEEDRKNVGKTAISSSVAGFPTIMVGGNPDGEALVSEFANRYGAGDPPGARKALKDYYRSLGAGSFVEVRNPDERTAELPDGPISYQAVLAVARYPSTPDRASRGFTALVDQALGLDGDFVHRIRPSGVKTDRDLAETERQISAEANANTDTYLDADHYGDMRSETREYAAVLRSDAASARLEVSTFFILGAPRLDALTSLIPTVKSRLTGAGYRLHTPVGLAEELWDMTWPLSSPTGLTAELEGTTTAALLGQYAPMRFHRVGDAKGIPLGQNLDNALGSDVYLDLMHATEEGNGSIALTGAQGRGKSHTMKTIVGWLADLTKTAVILDAQGEWMTYAKTLPSHQQVDLVNPTVSVDPLKVLPFNLACEVLSSLFLPLLGVSPDTEAGAILASRFDPEWVKSRGCTTTRELLEAITSKAARHEQIADALASLRRLLNNRIADAFIDPEINGRVHPLPAAKFDAKVIVFYTRGLALPQSGVSHDQMTLQERFGLMANTAVAMFTKYIFDVRAETAAFVLDEAHFLDGLDVLTPLIKRPDREGRKYGTFVLVGSQTGEELSTPEYKLIAKRFCMGQDNPANAIEALEWASFIASPGLVDDLVSNTSPLRRNRNNRPVEGRAGECFANLGSGKGKLRVFDIMRTDRRRIADTTASKFTRYVADAPAEAPARSVGQHAAPVAAGAGR